jgi:hypothetical protein
MSAIGNYIHYKNYNYRKYGIVFPDGQPKYNGYAEALKVFKAQKENIKKRIKTSKSSGKDLQSLEKYLNDLLHHKGANTSVSSEEAYKAFLKLVNDAFSDTFKDFFTFGEGG